MNASWKNIFVCGALTFALCAPAQTGGSGASVFSFLNLPVSARVNALGGTTVSLQEDDISFGFENPALLNDATDKALQLNYCFYLPGTNLGSALYGQNFGRTQKNHFLAFGLQFLSFGKMDYYDVDGQYGGVFTASDFVVSAIYARRLSRHFTVGVALKPIFSFYERYSSLALGADVGAHFKNQDTTLHVGLVLRNIGWQLKGFYSREGGQQREKLPLNLELGINYKVPNAPFRLGFTAHNLQRWRLDYDVSNIAEEDKIGWADMFFRHTIFAIEALPKSERFYLAMSYNHRRNRELRHTTARSLAGFALGAGFAIKKLHVDIAISQLNKRTITAQVSLTTDLDWFLD